VVVEEAVAMADGFLGRWSQRKLDVKQGKVVEAEPPSAPATQAVTPALTSVTPATHSVIPAQAGIHPHDNASHADSRLRGNDELVGRNDEPPTLQDAQSLTPDSDFSRFTAPDVTPEVKNAAMKKLFSDPHFNVMDGLDVYIDDYSQPDPMPESMLRSLASAEFLGLLRDDETDEAAGRARVPADDRVGEIVAQSDAAASALPEALSGIEPPAPPVPPAVPAEGLATHADPDLRLQQDHAPGRKGPGHGDR
jgi:hypothetical protein